MALWSNHRHPLPHYTCSMVKGNQQERILVWAKAPTARWFPCQHHVVGKHAILHVSHLADRHPAMRLPISKPGNSMNLSGLTPLYAV